MLLLCSIIVITLLVILVKMRLNFWKNRGVPTPTNMYSLMWKMYNRDISQTELWMKIYQDFRSRKVQHGGMIFFPSLIYVPIDIDLVKRIMGEDFNHFLDRGFYHNEKADPLSAHLFSLEGEKWKELRPKLTPTFTPVKLRVMFRTLVNCTKGLCEAIDEHSGKAIDMKDIAGRFTTDTIASCAFGIESNTLKNPDSEFRHKRNEAFDTSNLKNFFLFAAPDLMKKLNMRLFKPEVSDFFLGLVKDTIEYREKNNVVRKDFMQFLMELKNRGDGKLSDKKSKDTEGGLTVEQIAAQALVFYLAGFESSSTTMAFILYELAKFKDVQEKVREEIKKVWKKYDGKLTYEAVSEMQYLEQTVNEGLRKYPTVPILYRVCTEDYQVKGTDLVLEKGTTVNIPMLGIHFDPEYYPDPEKFDPDRFTEENKSARPDFTFLPFGEGPRECIAIRFGMMQIKVGLIATLLNYEIHVSKQTKEPLEFDEKSVLLMVKGGLWLDLKKMSPETVHICDPIS